MKFDTGISVVFVGHFSPFVNKPDEALSAAGNLTQSSIIEALDENESVKTVTACVMNSRAAWPKGSVWVAGKKAENLHALGYLNFPLFKHFWFAVRLFYFLIKLRPNLCVQYNSYFFENIVILMYRFFFPRTRIAIIIQDVHVQVKYAKNIKLWFRTYIEMVGIACARHFDTLIPITDKIIRDFNFDEKKSFVFQGGVTGRTLCGLHQSAHERLDDIAVFAGAFEPHNGIDVLLKRWAAGEMRTELHMFGRGSLENMVKGYAEKSKYIVYHGFCSEDEVYDLQSKARWLISLRYSVGLNQDYFFPSKLFNLLALNGNVLVNNFNNLPRELLPYLVILDDKLLCLEEGFLIKKGVISVSMVNDRHQMLIDRFSWVHCIDRLISGHVLNENLSDA